MKNKLFGYIASLCILSSSLSAIENKHLNTWARCQIEICEEFIFELSQMYGDYDLEMHYWFGKMQAYSEIAALTTEDSGKVWYSDNEFDHEDDGYYEDVIF